jgi:hypothetical protein
MGTEGSAGIKHGCRHGTTAGFRLRVPPYRSPRDDGNHGAVELLGLREDDVFLVWAACSTLRARGAAPPGRQSGRNLRRISIVNSASIETVDNLLLYIAILECQIVKVGCFRRRQSFGLCH